MEAAGISAGGPSASVLLGTDLVLDGPHIAKSATSGAAELVCAHSAAGWPPCLSRRNWETRHIILRRLNVMGHVKNILSGLAAIFFAEFLPLFPWSPFKGMSEQKATGLAAVAGGFAAIFSPLFWIVVILFFVLFYGASRLGNRFLRILLFWIPILLASTLGGTLFALFAYVLIHH